MGWAGHSHLLTLRHSLTVVTVLEQSPTEETLLVCVHAGIPSAAAGRCLHNKAPIPKAGLWWGMGKGRGSFWFLSVLGLENSPTLPVSWRRSYLIPVSLWSAWARALSSVTGTMDSAQSSRSLHWA